MNKNNRHQWLLLTQRRDQKMWEHHTFRTKREAIWRKDEIHDENYPFPMDAAWLALTRFERAALCRTKGIPFTRVQGPFKIACPAKDLFMSELHTAINAGLTQIRTAIGPLTAVTESSYDPRN